VIGSVALLVACAGIATVLVSFRPCTAEGGGVQWIEATPDEVLSRARQEKRRVLLEFSASWCPSCKALEAEVLSTRDGVELAAGLLPLRVDFDAESSRPLVERYVVLSLPTVVVLTPEGEQVGRVEGYDGRDDWLAKARDAVRSNDPLPALRAALNARPDDLATRLRLGHALLVRGETADGEAFLEGVVWQADARHAAEAAEALFVLGRYYQRVKRDPATARHVWRELATRFPDSEWASGAWWWYAKAQVDLGRHEAGFVALRSRAQKTPDHIDAVLELGELVASHEALKVHRAEALAAVERVSAKAPSDRRGELAELAARLRE
jgi:thiol-disulfide isomerase/thioredoxin